MQPTAAKPDFDHISLPALQVFMCVAAVPPPLPRGSSHHAWLCPVVQWRRLEA